MKMIKVKVKKMRIMKMIKMIMKMRNKMKCISVIVGLVSIRGGSLNWT